MRSWFLILRSASERSASRRRRPGRALPRARGRVRDRDGAPRHLHVEALDHLAADLDRALAGMLGPLERRDDLPRPRDLVRARRERGVARLDLAGVNQRLAVKTEVARLRALCREARP